MMKMNCCLFFIWIWPTKISNVMLSHYSKVAHTIEALNSQIKSLKIMRKKAVVQHLHSPSRISKHFEGPKTFNN